MLPVEFKSWFNGFNENINHLPTEFQWAKIKTMIREMDTSSIDNNNFSYYQNTVSKLDQIKTYQNKSQCASNE